MEIIVRSRYKDKSGERIHFKEPYYDRALKKSFSSAREKAEFLNSKGLVDAGCSDAQIKKDRKAHEEVQAIRSELMDW